MEEANKEVHIHPHGEACNGCCCNHGHGHRYFIIRWLLGLLALAIVFAIGVKVGEFKQLVRGEFGFGGPMRGGRMFMMRGDFDGQPNMMYFQRNTAPVPQQAATSTPVKK